MKRVSGFILTAAFMLFFIGQTFAQSADATATSQDAKQATTTTVAGKNFVDSNSNGVCDHHESRMKDGKCEKFVDADGDGKCDNCANCSGECKGNANCCKGQQNCCAKGKSMGNTQKGCAGPCGGKMAPDKK